VDPVVSVRFGSKVRTTAKKDDVGQLAVVRWEEHLFFETHIDTPEQLAAETLNIEVFDSRHILKNDLLGSYEMDATYLYGCEKHALVHKWLAITNAKSKDFTKVRAYLKVGISLLGDGDELVDLNVKLPTEAKTEEILLPPQIQQKGCQITVRCVRGEHFPQLDVVGTLDAYCVAEFAGNKATSKYYAADTANRSVTWNEDLLVPAILPVVSGRVKVAIWDHDLGSKDDFVGELFFEFEEIMKGKLEKLFWANIYGSPPGALGDWAIKMSSEPELATFWRGRVLLSLKAEEMDKPELIARPIPDSPEYQRTVLDLTDNFTEYEIRCQVFSGVYLPFTGEKLQIQLRWGSAEAKSASVKNTGGSCNWYETLPRKRVTSYTLDGKDLPDVFLYLCKGDTILSYARMPSTLGREKTAAAIWVPFLPDKAVGKVANDWEGGLVRLRVYIGVLNSEREDLATGRWNVKPVKPPENGRQLLVNVYQCRNLPAADSDGAADPYLQLQCGAASVSTPKEERLNNLNPVWYRTIPLPVMCNNKEDAPPVVIYVWDYDATTGDDLMGRCVIPVRTRVDGRGFGRPFNAFKASLEAASTRQTLATRGSPGLSEPRFHHCNHQLQPSVSATSALHQWTQ